MPEIFDHESYCTRITEETRLLGEIVRGSSPSAPVPTCPGWTLRDLAVHLGDGHLWAAHIVGTRATSFVPSEDAPGHGGPAPAADPATDAEALETWLNGSARTLVDELRAAGPESDVWTFLPDRRAAFWARRRALETLVHRADAALAAGVEFEAEPALAADAVDEWLEIVTSEEAAEYRPQLRTFSERAGGTVHLHATDTEDGLDAEWLISLREDGAHWRRAHEKATVALRGPMTDVLSVFFRRLPPTSERVEVLGDAELLDFWLERASFE